MLNIEVTMERATLDNLPSSTDAASCIIRGYQSGDEVIWTRIQTEADRHNTITSGLFANQFGDVIGQFADRILFAVVPTVGTVGTAAAWWGSSPKDTWGRVHWVAVQPAWQRRGIGRKLLVAVCHRLRHLGHERAFLTTSPVRPEALRLYLSLGFLPRIAQPLDVEVWREVASQLGNTALKAWLEKDAQSLNEKAEMTASDVVALLQLMEQSGIEVYIDGGWGVDALLGKQTRSHSDLDVALPHKYVPQLRKVLAARGYEELPGIDTRDCNFVLGDAEEHQVDVHSYTFDDEGKNVQGVAYVPEYLTGTGSINGYPVRCISPEWMVKFHSGYKLDQNDYRDVLALCQRFGISMPSEYEKFAKHD